MFFTREDWNIEGATNLFLKWWGYYKGYWGRVLYFFLGVQAVVTFLIITLDHISKGKI